MSEPATIAATLGGGKGPSDDPPSEQSPAAGAELNEQRALLPEAPLIYVATPLSAGRAPTRLQLEAAVADARRAAQILRSVGHRVFCPVETFVPMAFSSGLDPLDAGLWWEASAPFLHRADQLAVVMMPGWVRSWATAMEVQVFRDAGKPVWWLDWPEMTWNREGAEYVTVPLIPRAVGTPRPRPVPMAADAAWQYGGS